jgi:hypothetical protein
MEQLPQENIYFRKKHIQNPKGYHIRWKKHMKNHYFRKKHMKNPKGKIITSGKNI